MVRRVAALLVLGLTTGCASPVSNAARFSVPFEYEGLGAGPSPALGVVELPKGGEARVVSRAIVLALQQLDLSIPQLSLTELISPGKSWETDVAPVPEATVRRHNSVVEAHHRLPQRYYRRQSAGEYTVNKDRLEFTVMVKLYSGGAAGEFRPYEVGYSAVFFVDELQALIRDRLKTADSGQVR